MLPNRNHMTLSSFGTPMERAYLKRVITAKQVFSKLRVSAPQKKIIVAASTHPDDEQILLPALHGLWEKYSLILVPRHPKRSSLIQDELNRIGFSSTRWTEGKTSDLDKNILISSIFLFC